MTQADQRSDEDLVTSFLKGESSASAVLAHRYAPGLYDFSIRVTLDPEAAAQATENTLGRISSDLPSRPNGLSFLAWIYGIARDEALEALRQRARGDGSRDETRPGALAPMDSRFLHASSDISLDAASWAWGSARGQRPRDYSILDLILRRKITPEEVADIASLSRNGVYGVIGRLRGAFEESFVAAALYSSGRRACSELAAIVGDAPSLGPAMRRDISRHAESCEVCQATSAALPGGADVFSALLDVEIPDDLADRLLPMMLAAMPEVETAAPSSTDHVEDEEAEDELDGAEAEEPEDEAGGPGEAAGDAIAAATVIAGAAAALAAASEATPAGEETPTAGAETSPTQASLLDQSDATAAAPDEAAAEAPVAAEAAEALAGAGEETTEAGVAEAGGEAAVEATDGSQAEAVAEESQEAEPVESVEADEPVATESAAEVAASATVLEETAEESPAAASSAEQDAAAEVATESEPEAEPELTPVTADTSKPESAEETADAAEEDALEPELVAAAVEEPAAELAAAGATKRGGKLLLPSTVGTTAPRNRANGAARLSVPVANREHTNGDAGGERRIASAAGAGAVGAAAGLGAAAAAGSRGPSGSTAATDVPASLPPFRGPFGGQSGAGGSASGPGGGSSGRGGPPSSGPFAKPAADDDGSSKKKYFVYAVVALATAVALYVGIAVGASLQTGGGGGGGGSDLPTRTSGITEAACPGPINLNQGSRVALAFSSAPSGFELDENPQIRPITPTAAVTQVEAISQEGNSILFSAHTVPNSAGRTDEYRVIATFVKGSERQQQECTVRVMGPAGTPVAPTATPPAAAPTNTAVPPTATRPPATQPPLPTFTPVQPTATPDLSTPTSSVPTPIPTSGGQLISPTETPTLAPSPTATRTPLAPP